VGCNREERIRKKAFIARVPELTEKIINVSREQFIEIPHTKIRV